MADTPGPSIKLGIMDVLGFGLQFLVILFGEIFSAQARQRAADEKFTSKEQALEAAALRTMDAIRAKMGRDNDVARRQQQRLDDLMSGKDDG